MSDVGDVVIDVVIPTVKGREAMVERAVELYHQNSQAEVHVKVIHDHPTVGSAWVEGVEWFNRRYARDEAPYLAGSRYVRFLHLSGDDLEPQPRWDEFAIEVADQSMQPCPLQLHADGTPFQWGRSTTEVASWAPVTATTLPFVSWNLWDMIAEWDSHGIFTSTLRQLHYYSDDWISHVAQRFGWKDVYHGGYAFVHHLATIGSMRTQSRMDADHAVYQTGIEKWNAHYGILHVSSAEESGV